MVIDVPKPIAITILAESQWFKEKNVVFKETSVFTLSISGLFSVANFQKHELTVMNT